MERCDREKTVWELFTKKGDFVATCNTCHKDYSYRASTSNLRKHWQNKHRKNMNGKKSKQSDSDSSDVEQEQEKPISVKKPKATWNYFEVLDSDKFEATCKICDKVIPFSSSSDLTQHVQDEHDEEPKDSDDEYTAVTVETKPYKRKHFKSAVWKYFTATDDKMAVCLVCKNIFNYASTITNLRRHLARKHQGATTPTREERAKMFRVSEDGVLYEIEALQENNGDENQEDPMATDTVYLNEDEIDFLDEVIPITPSSKKPRLIKPQTSKITKEPLRRSQDTRSAVLELHRKQVPMPTPSTPTPNTMSSLDYFGQYVVSLLKELPKPVSDQLQTVIIKQILTSKMALEPQNVTPQYEIKISQNNEEVTNVPEPDDVGDLQKPTDVYRYYNTESGKKAQCIVCKANVTKEYDDLKAHLKDEHPDLLLELLQDQNSEAGSNDGNDNDTDNTYTEIVYLEQDPTAESPKKRKEIPKSYPKPVKKRERQHSFYSSDDLPLKKARKEEENDEFSTFINYITCLLKKLPADAFSNVQIEIINAILQANKQVNEANTSQSMVLNKEQVNTSSKIITVDGITPISSDVIGHHNYTITVAPNKETETEITTETSRITS